jgi:hypothetical protein
MKTSICGKPCSTRAGTLLAKLLKYAKITEVELPQWAWERITPEMLQELSGKTTWRAIQRYRGAGAYTVRDLDSFFQSVGVVIPFDAAKPPAWNINVSQSGWYWWKATEFGNPEILYVESAFKPPKYGFWAGPLLPPE